MKFSVPLGLIAKLLGRARKVAKHGAPPKIRHARVTVTPDGVLTTVASDRAGTLWVTERVQLDGDFAAGSAVLAIPTLQKAIQAGSTRDKVEVEVGDDAVVVVTVGDLAPLRCLPAPVQLGVDDAPPQTPILSVVATLSTADLMRAFGAVSCAVSPDRIHPNLCGVECIMLDDGLRLTATDGHRLATWRGAAVGPEGTIGIVPGFVVEAVSSLADEGDPAEIATDGRMVSIRCGGVTYTAPLIEGTFPNFDRVLPAEKQSRKWSVRRQAWLRQLKRAAAMANKATRCVVVTAAESGLKLAWRDNDGAEFETTTPFVSPPARANEVTAFFNVDFLIDMAESFSCDIIWGELSGPLQPALFVGGGYAGLRHIVMPMRHYAGESPPPPAPGDSIRGGFGGRSAGMGPATVGETP